MAKKTRASESTQIHDKNAPFVPSKILVSTKTPNPVIPTYSHRHITSIRLGKISGEVFCKNPTRRKELGLAPLPLDSFISDLRA